MKKRSQGRKGGQNSNDAKNKIKIHGMILVCKWYVM
jgi:hypothetical protein